MTVQQLLENTSNREIEEWKAFERLEPFTGKRLDINFGYIAWMIHQAMGGGDKNKKTWMGDFILDYDDEYLTKKQKRQKLKQINKQRVHGNTMDPEDMIKVFSKLGS